MDLYNFQKNALRTESVVSEIVTNKDELCYIIEAFILLSEILDGYKKKIFYNKDVKYNNLIEKLPKKLEEVTCKIMNSHDNDPKKLENIDTRAIHGMLGIMTETGELASILLNYIQTGEIDVYNLAEELADGAGGTNSWYGTLLCDVFKIDPNDPPDKVIRKLKVRYPEKYCDSLANNRDLSSERMELEK
jgi:NTP pyrophosphatase (non-canonical NTP hydrolase)